MKQTMPEAKGYAVGVEVRGGVVAKVFRVAEDEAGFVTVVGIPGDGRDDVLGKGQCPDEMDSA